MDAYGTSNTMISVVVVFLKRKSANLAAIMLSFHMTLPVHFRLSDLPISGAGGRSHDIQVSHAKLSPGSDRDVEQTIYL